VQNNEFLSGNVIASPYLHCSQNATKHNRTDTKSLIAIYSQNLN